ncbi:hypothetical protein ACM55G_10555 [Flavobacterium sp. LB3P122]|uniref:hypothetical protein n=1 Tax=Flavobacterium algoriphilum TaxID=3398738 RepID=UPI003A8C4C40
MKTLRQFSLKPVLIIIKINSACNPNMNDLNTGNRLKGVTPIDNQNGVTIIVTDGTLKINFYWDTDGNEIINFNGFNFSFGANNVLSATDGTNTYTGTWSITDTNGYIDNLSDLKFDITFTPPINFVEIIDDWEIIDNSSSYIKLKEVVGSNGGTDFLAFSKN